MDAIKKNFELFQAKVLNAKIRNRVILVLVLVFIAVVLLVCFSCAQVDQEESGHKSNTMIEQAAIVASERAVEEQLDDLDRADENVASSNESESDEDSAHALFSNGVASNNEKLINQSYDSEQQSSISSIDSTVNQTSHYAENRHDEQSKNLVTAQKIWVEDTTQKKVIDQEAWTERVPVYKTVELSICSICGEDITGQTSAHGKRHALAGEGTGHHSEYRQVVDGYKTVEHPEVSHLETVVVGGHWE